MVRHVLPCLFLLLLGFAQPSFGQVRMLMENRDVRVYEVTIAAGFKEPGFHKHVVPYVFYVLNAGRANVRPEHGDATLVDYRLGDVGYGEVENHAVDNVGSSDIRVLIVDLKTPRAAKDAKRASLLAQALAAVHGTRRY
jgi:hypothetical protein